MWLERERVVEEEVRGVKEESEKVGLKPKNPRVLKSPDKHIPHPLGATGNSWAALETLCSC